MNVFATSDLHYEQLINALTIPDSVDIIVLAGDLEHPKLIFERFAMIGRPIICVAGNHDFFGKEITEGVIELKTIAANYPDVFVLENEAIEIKGIRFIGSTFWASYGDLHPRLVAESLFYMRDSLAIKATKWWLDERNADFAMSMHEELMNKYRYDARLNHDRNLGYALNEINKEKFHPIIGYQLNQKAVNYIAETLATPFDGQTVVVTHHPPTFECLRHTTAGGEAINVNSHNDLPFKLPTQDAFSSIRCPEPVIMANYGSPLKHLFSKNLYSAEQSLAGADLWIHGHTHENFEYAIRGTRFVVNALTTYKDIEEVESKLIKFSDKLDKAFSYLEHRTVNSINNAIEHLSKWADCDEVEQIQSVEIQKLILMSLEDSHRSVCDSLIVLEKEFTDGMGIPVNRFKQDILGVTTNAVEFHYSIFIELKNEKADPYMLSLQHIRDVIKRFENIKSMIASGEWKNTILEQERTN